MRILHITPAYLPARRYGGPIQSVHILCKSLVQIGHEVHVFTTTLDGNKNLDGLSQNPVNLDGVNIWYFPVPRLKKIFYAPEMKKALLAHIKSFDVVHIHTLFSWPSFIAGKIARLHDVPYVISPRGMLVKELIRKKNYFAKKLWIALFDRPNLKRAGAIHATAEIEAKEIRLFDKAFPKSTVIPNAIAPREIPTETGSDTVKRLLRKNPLLLYLGRISWKKGLDRLILAMALLPKNISLVIVGNDEENHTDFLKSLVKKKGLGERVELSGPIYEQDKNYLLNKVSALVLPSYNENFGNVVLEAMLMACPVVITPEVGLAETVTKTKCGVVAKGDPESFSKAIKEMLENPDQLKEMGMRGRAAAFECFEPKKIGEQMAALYKQISRSSKVSVD